MTDAIPLIACPLLAYLIGAIPFGLIVARSRGINIREVGSGNIGATNVFRSVGKGWGLLTFLLDAAKGFLPVLLLPMVTKHVLDLETGQTLPVLCACAAIAGHNWPVYLQFHGGKGVATSAGALIALAPAALGFGLLAWIIILLCTRYVSVASITAALTLAGVSWWLYMDSGLALPVTLSCLGLLVVARHHANIMRLMKGTENRFQFKKAQVPTTGKETENA